MRAISGRVATLLLARVELYRLPKAAALAVIGETEGKGDASTVVDELRRRAGSDGIELAAAPTVTTRSGQKATVEVGGAYGGSRFDTGGFGFRRELEAASRGFRRRDSSRDHPDDRPGRDHRRVHHRTRTPPPMPTPNNARGHQTGASRRWLASRDVDGFERPDAFSWRAFKPRQRWARSPSHSSS